jgi:hypothetical protein
MKYIATLLFVLATSVWSYNIGTLSPAIARSEQPTNAIRVQATQNACDLAQVTTDYAPCYQAQDSNNTEYLCKNVTKIPFKAVSSCWVEAK